jgi:hypothetical protein
MAHQHPCDKECTQDHDGRWVHDHDKYGNAGKHHHIFHGDSTSVRTRKKRSKKAQSKKK